MQPILMQNMIRGNNVGGTPRVTNDDYFILNNGSMDRCALFCLEVLFKIENDTSRQLKSATDDDA